MMMPLTTIHDDSTKTENGHAAVSSAGFVRKAMGDAEEALYGCLTSFNTMLVRGADFGMTHEHLTMLFELPSKLSRAHSDLAAVILPMLEAVARLLACNRDVREGKGERQQIYQ